LAGHAQLRPDDTQRQPGTVGDQRRFSRMFRRQYGIASSQLVSPATRPAQVRPSRQAPANASVWIIKSWLAAL
jgi:hypothetical protein